jgi:hypothetical protein
MVLLLQEDKVSKISGIWQGKYEQLYFLKAGKLSIPSKQVE